MALLLLCLCVLGCSPLPESGPAGGKPCATEGDFEPVRRPVLGFALEHDSKRDLYRLVAVDREGRSAESRREVVRGTLEKCEEELISLLKERYGTGKPNIPFATLGGKQLWSDLLIYCGWRIQESQLTGNCRLLDPEDTRQAWGTFEACRVVLEEQRIERRLRPRSDHLVVLVHGLFRSKDSFSKLKGALEKGGYEVADVNYPSTRKSIREHVDQLEKVLDAVEGAKKVSFVTHSMGGIIVREVLSRDAAWKKRLDVGRLVMLAPPNKGSFVADRMKDFLPYRAVAGTSGVELTPEAVARVPLPSCSFGILAGGTGEDTGLNPLLPGDNDGTVLVENTRLEGAADYLLVRAFHSFIMNQEAVIEATLRFLKHGKFRAGPEARALNSAPGASEAPDPATP